MDHGDRCRHIPKLTTRYLCLALAASLGGIAVHGMSQARVPGGPPGSLLQALEHELRTVVDAVSPSVVTIRSACRMDSGRTPKAGSSSLSVGSGVIMDTLGRILTTSRVIEDADDFWVESADGRLFQATLLGTHGDVAVLQITATNLVPARFGDGANLGVGSFVAAIGNSYGYSGGLSWGEVNGFRPDGTIQMSLGVSAGSSGGALVNSRGEVIGLVKAKISEPFYVDPLLLPAGEGRGSVTVPGRRLELPTSSVSLAIPITVALRAAGRVTDVGFEAPAYIGVYVEDLTGWYAAHFKTENGVLVTGVVEHTPAARFGIKQGDVIVTVDRQVVPSVRRFRQIISQSRPGQRLMIDLLRGGKPLKVALEAGRADLPELQVSTAPSSSALGPSGGSPFWLPSAIVQDRLARPDRPGLGAAPKGDQEPTDWAQRLRRLEQIVDSLQQELSALRHTGQH
ncbi:MAG: trypsin-like peptidase domain-containing protein [Candidatus Zixiibacteriota bacterium]